jgi:guanylate kinase
MKRTKSRIVLCGKAASGKDHLRQILEGRGFSYGISYTTRPPRDNEVDGRDYYFIDESEFQSLIDEKFFYEHVSFNGWFYGTSREQWYETDDVFIMTPSGINKIKIEDRKSTFVIYIDIPIEVRRERLSKRSDADSVDRRLQADENDFKNFTDFDIRINDHKF